jgi:tetratricopeptide (TPR) repeat protein
MTKNDQFSTVLEELQLGDTTTAIRFLGSAWRGIGKRPRSTGSASQLAERLLLSGILTSQLATAESLRKTNDSAQRLLNDSHELFARLHDRRQYIAVIESALSYSRAGQWKSALERLASIRTTDQILNFQRVLAQASISIDANQFDEAIAALTSIDGSIGAMPHFLRGTFYQHRAASRFGLAQQKETLKETLTRVLDDYESALSNYEDAGSLIGQASVRYHLIPVLSRCNEPARALHHAGEARKLFTRLNNHLMFARTEHLAAAIYLSQGNCSHASRSARLAAQHFQERNQQSLFAQTLVILGRSLARLGETDAAQDELKRADTIFEELDDNSGRAHTALSLIEEIPLDTPSALQALALATQLAANAELRERTRLAASQLGVQLISDNTLLFSEIQAHADHIKTQVVSRTLAKYGGPNARGAIVRSAHDLGLTHTGLVTFLDQHPDLGHKKRPRSVLSNVKPIPRRRRQGIHGQASS